MLSSKPLAARVGRILATLAPFLFIACSDSPTQPADLLRGEFEGTLEFEGATQLDIPTQLRGTAIHGYKEGEDAGQYYHWITMLPRERNGLVSLNLLRVTNEPIIRAGGHPVGTVTPEMWDSQDPAQFADEWVFLILIQQPDGELGRIFSTGGAVDIHSDEVAGSDLVGNFELIGTGVVVTSTGQVGQEVSIRFSGGYRSMEGGGPHPPF
jgi:hypothetical protein